MSRQGWVEVYSSGEVDGPTLTAAAAASCLPTHVKGLVLPNGFFDIGRKLRAVLKGRISCVVTTPGTARFDVRLGGTVIFDTGALNLNVVAKTNVPFELEVTLVCRSIGSGTGGTLFGFAKFVSEAVIGAPANSAGGNGVLLAPVGAPAVGSGFDTTNALAFDMFFTQTVATGSLTVHEATVESMN